jgi:uncharacterized protein (TIGR00369 family)
VPITHDRYALAALFGAARDELVQHTPHCQSIGLRVIEMGPGQAVIALPHRPELVGDPERGVVFGGVITTMLDHASGIAVFCSLEDLKTIATLDLRIDYLRAAEPGHELYAEARCYKLTRNVAFVRGSAWDRDREDPFATHLATFMLGSSVPTHPLATAATRAAEAPLPQAPEPYDPSEKPE